METATQKNEIPLPQYGRDYYLAIVRNYPKRLDTILNGFGWDKTKLFEMGEKAFPSPNYPNLCTEEKAAILLWQMETEERRKFQSTAYSIRALLIRFLPEKLVDAAIQRFRTEM